MTSYADPKQLFNHMIKLSNSVRIFITNDGGHDEGDIFIHLMTNDMDDPEEIILDIFEIKKLNTILTDLLKEQAPK